MKNAITAAQGVGRVKMTPEAADAWESIYEPLSEGEAGMVGAIFVRAEAQVIRLSLIYALLEGCDRLTCRI